MINKETNKKILLISYHFLPSLAVGGFRIAGFAEKLLLYGWDPYVLTIKEKYIDNIDIANSAHLKTVKIFRTNVFPTFLDVYLLVKRLIFSVLSRKKVSLKEMGQQYAASPKSVSVYEGLIHKLKRYFISLFLTLPDVERAWIIPATLTAIREIKNEKINCILTSSPPHSVHIIGLMIKKIVPKIRWIADFRDPWMTPFSKGLYLTCSLSNRIERRLEHSVIKNADLVLTTTDLLANKFKHEYKMYPKTKFKCLPNGFDEDTFKELKKIKKNKAFTISYTGSIYLGRSPEPLFKALYELVNEKLLSLHNISIQLVGNCQYIDGRPTPRVASEYGLDSVVKIIDYVPYNKALEIIKKSHVALLLAPNQPYQIPAKAYDYIGAATEILALTKDGATADLINSTGTGKAIDPADIQGIKNYIHDLAVNEKKSVKDREEVCNQYNRGNIVRTLSQELDRITFSDVSN